MLLPLFLLLAAARALGFSGPATPPQHLFPYSSQGRWGLLDSTGTVVVPARFHTVGAFAEGRAAAREGARFGYIDASGGLVLPAAYDYASAFHQGYAVVWVSGRAGLIDQRGRFTIAPRYQHLEWVSSPGRADYLRASTTTGREGLLDTRGRLLVDTAYARVMPFACGRAVVTGLKEYRYRRPNTDGHSRDTTTTVVERPATGVVDSRGQLVVPFGKFSSISAFHRGVAQAELLDRHNAGYPDADCLLDTTGRVLAVLPGRQLAFPYSHSGLTDGVAVVRVYRSDPEKWPADSADEKNEYRSVIDETGAVLFRNPAIQELTPFARHRAWARLGEKQWHLVDRQGRFISKTPYEEIIGLSEYPYQAVPFADGFDFVKAADAYLALDTAGALLAPPLRVDFPHDDVYRAGELLVFQQRSTGEAPARYGFWEPRTGLLQAPRYDAVSSQGFVGGLLAVAEAGREGYVDRRQRLRWQADTARRAPGRLNVDFMNRAVYRAASDEPRGSRSLGGWASSENKPRRCRRGQFAAGQLQLLAAPAAAGIRLQVANTTARRVVFDAQDSQLYLLLQARDEQGQWRDIEYTPQSFCGNSYHRLQLRPGQYWELAAPAYEGGLPTRLRVKLTLRHPRQAADNQVVYSNEFAGSVNPAQFWRKPGYHRGNIMDPYLD